MKFQQMVVGAGVCSLGILAANVGMAALNVDKTIADTVLKLLSDWPILIFFYFLVLISVLIWEFLVERRHPKK